MDSAEYKRAFSGDRELITDEDPPDKDRNAISYTCEYLRTSSHESAGTLVVFASPGERSEKTSLKTAATICSGAPKFLPGNAFYCDYQHDQYEYTYLAVAKFSHGEMRIAMVTGDLAPDPTRADQYTSVAKSLTERL
ncbi:hypothetical protein AB0383_27725 [Amycolatopsis sp. NPDC051373]|uniref:hypothetical protein n=1 Tax=Amycolatopsis sp. NPDC051373 TaxID=3155801 RepID=UPI00344EC43F